MYRFLQTPPSGYIAPDDYANKFLTWNADIHLISTYCFLSKEETQVFAAEDHVYLIKDVFEHKYENITGSKRVKMNSNGMVANWMWYMQRNDVNLRKQAQNTSLKAGEYLLKSVINPGADSNQKVLKKMDLVAQL